MSCKRFACRTCAVPRRHAATAQAQSAARRSDSGRRSRRGAGHDRQGRRVNQTQPDGTTPLHWAVYRVDRELVAALLKKGARAHVVNKYGASPLAEAVRVANLEMSGMLLEAGADANVANEDGQTALMLAARTGNVAVARLLVQHGADVNKRESYRDQSAVMWAAAQGHADMVAFLVSQRRRPHRPSPGQRLDRRRSPASRACSIARPAA